MQFFRTHEAAAGDCIQYQQGIQRERWRTWAEVFSERRLEFPALVTGKLG